MKKVTIAELVAKPINELTYDELVTLRSFVNGHQFNSLFRGAMKADWDRSENERNKHRAALEKKKAKEQDEKHFLTIFAANYINPRDLVRFKGTRDTLGTREVLCVKSHSITGAVVELRYFRQLADVPNVPHRDYTGNSSENGIEKLTGWYDKPERLWRDRAWMLEKGKTWKQPVS